MFIPKNRHFFLTEKKFSSKQIGWIKPVGTMNTAFWNQGTAYQPAIISKNALDCFFVVSRVQWYLFWSQDISLVPNVSRHIENFRGVPLKRDQDQG